ncbi:MAG: hypothetical protein AAGC60_00775 [Acidobacteriota bacterium]
MPYTRVAVVQLPEDLRAHFLPASFRSLSLETQAATDEATKFLEQVAGKLDQLDREIHRLAEEREAACLEAIVEFARARGVDILALPQLTPRSRWIERLRRVQQQAQIPVITLGPTFFHPRGNEDRSNEPVEHQVVLNGSSARVYCIDPRQMIPDPGDRQSGFVIVSGSSSQGIDDTLRETLHRHRVERGIASAICASFDPQVASRPAAGHGEWRGSSFIARTWREQSGRCISEREPLGAPLYEVPRPSLGVNILDIDFAMQQGAWLQTDGFHTRSVTVAPIIAEEDYPEYVGWLWQVSSTPWFQRVLSKQAQIVRRQTLSRLADDGVRGNEVLRQKLLEIDRAGGDADKLSELNRYSDPEDEQRLVDVVIVLRQAERALVGSIRESLQGLFRVLETESAAAVPRSVVEKVQALTLEYEPSERHGTTHGVHFEPTRLWRVNHDLELIRSYIEAWSPKPLPDLFTTDHLMQWPSIGALSNEILSFVAATVDYLTAGQSTSMDMEYFAAEWSILSRLAAIDDQHLEDDFEAAGIGPLDDVPRGETEIVEVDLELLKRHPQSSPPAHEAAAKTPERSEAQSRLLQIVDAEHRRREAARDSLGHHAGEAVERPSPIPWLERQLIRRRALALHRMLDDRPATILLGLCDELAALMVLLVLGRRERLVRLAGLPREVRDARAARLRSRHERLWARLKGDVESLLSDPERHWRKIPEIRKTLDKLLCTREEVNALARLLLLDEGLLPNEPVSLEDENGQSE